MKITILTVAVLILPLLPAGLAAPEDGRSPAPTVTVPRGPAPSLDGTLSPAEWSGARRFDIPGGQVLLLCADDSLYVGLRTPDRAVGSLCVDQGDRIAVLHSSGALGTAIYAPAREGWRLTRPFSWRCRNQPDAARLAAERTLFWRDEHWLASTALAGQAGALAYRIALPKGGLRLAVAGVRVADRKILFWPPTLADDTRNPDLIGGYAPGMLQFFPAQWITVMPADEAAAANPSAAGPTARGPYFGEPTPGDTPVVFARAFLSARIGFPARIAFSPDGRECFVTAADPKSSRPKILVTERKGDTWTEPALAPFTVSHYRSNEPFISADGNRLYFSSDPDGRSATNRRDIWMVERTPGGWGRLQRLPPPLNSDYTELFYSQSAAGTIYFISNRPGGLGGFDIYRAHANPDQTLRVENPGAPLNSPADEWDPCIAPDERFLVFASTRPGGRGGSDLYVSFADGHGAWTAPANLGEGFNSPGDEWAPSLSPDGQYLFFTRYDGHRGELYWVRTTAIDRQRPDALRESPPAPQAEVRGPYFGQQLPGKTPQIFAPGIISLADRLEDHVAFSPDGNECFFVVWGANFSRARIYWTRCIDRVWTPAVEAPFSAGRYAAGPHFSADGNRLYYNASGGGAEPSHIWMVQRTPTGWGEPRPLPPPVNSSAREFSYSETTDGTAYFTSSRPGGLGAANRNDLWRARPAPGRTAEAENLGATVNSTAADFDPCVARDGSYLIFTSERPGKTGASDLYVSFRDGTGAWTAPVDLNDYCPGINVPGCAAVGPSLSPDGRFLFFTRYARTAAGETEDVYWVENPVLAAGPKT